MGTMGAPLRGLVALEAKLDILGRKLDSLLSNPRPAGCPHCSACGLHAGQQEAVVSMLTAQAQRLDALERLVLGMTQDGGATPNCVGGATPTHRGGATPDHKGGTTPNRVGGATSNPDAGATPTHKGEAAPNREGGATLSYQGGATPNREGATPEKSLFFRDPSPAKSPFGAAKEGIVKRTQPLKQQNVFVALQKGVPAQVKDEAKKDKAESLIKPLSPPLAGESEPKGITAAPSAPPMPSLSSKGSPHKAAPPKPEPAGHKPPLQTGEGKGAVRDDRGDSSKTTANPGVGVAKEQQAGIGQSGAPSPLQLPGQGVAKATLPTPPPPPPPPPSPDMLAVTPPTTGGKATFSLAPNKLLGVMVPTATTDSPTLRHVHSCPVSLQRIQDSEGSLQPKPPSSVAPPLGKRGSIAAVAPVTAVKPSVAAGIQIKVSPAPDITAAQGTPKSSPIVCHKILDDDPPRPAPFPHHVVSLRPSQPCDSYIINTREVLGGGRFGTVHRCTEKTSGLKLAAKIISTRSAKEKDMAVNEIQVMNQLSHPNIIQLFDAYEAKNQTVLIMEYVEGGELFERILDESFPLTELDAMIFVKQICEGIQYMHQMYVLHLDLKPENILCVNRSGHQVKIIDFGLARRYKPREKLRVSFGTPEFLAPEIVNFDFVSFPTDMWTVGVITYMLLSGLSPFLGDDDSQTLNNVLAVNWYFDQEGFEHVSPEAKDFISNLLIRERSGRLSATQCLKHPWLHSIRERAKRSNVLLKSQVQLRKYMAKRLWKKNYIAIAAANRFKKISSSGSLTTLGI